MARPEPMSADHDPSHLRLQTIVRLRWVAIAGQLATILVIFVGLHFQLPVLWCLFFIALSGVLNVGLRLRYPARHRLSALFATGLLAYDIAQLGALLYLTGGLTNPFVFLLVAPVTVSAAGLPLRNTIALGVLAIGASVILARFHAPLPWFEGQSFVLPTTYKIGVLASVASGMIFLALYAARLAKEARQMSDALAATEHVLAREQQLHALDGLAAAAAHELGTPLSTITLIAKELERELPPNSPFAEDAALLRTQAQRCREILKKLTRTPMASDPLHANMTLTQLLEEAATPYRGTDTHILVTSQPAFGAFAGGAGEPTHVRRPGVLYGLGNLIENAADFASSQVEVDARWDRDEITCIIKDDGPGFPPHVIDRLGEPYVTTRPHAEWAGNDDGAGLGLGFFIAKTLLERSGASVAFANRSEPESGAIVRVTWPRPVFEGTPADSAGPTGGGTRAGRVLVGQE